MSPTLTGKQIAWIVLGSVSVSFASTAPQWPVRFAACIAITVCVAKVWGDLSFDHGRVKGRLDASRALIEASSSKEHAGSARAFLRSSRFLLDRFDPSRPD